VTRPKHMQVPIVRELMRRLRKHAPLPVPVRIVQRRSPRICGDLVLGYCHRTLKGGPKPRARRFLIVVEERLSLGEKYEVIVHEYAHCLDRVKRPLDVKDCHDSRWGACYARAFRASTLR